MGMTQLPIRFRFFFFVFLFEQQWQVLGSNVNIRYYGKPANGFLKVISTTTLAEFRRSLEEDESLAKIYQKSYLFWNSRAQLICDFSREPEIRVVDVLNTSDPPVIDLIENGNSLHRNVCALWTSEVTFK